MKLEMAMPGRDFSARGEEAAKLEAQGFDYGVIFESSRDPFLQVLLAARQTDRLTIATGVAIAGRKRDDFEISCQTIVMMGANDEQIENARNKAKGQISFYGSTPAYQVVLAHMGKDDLYPELNRLSKEGKWLEMMSHVDDDMLDDIGVSGTPSEVGSKLVARNAPFADRTMLTMYDETRDPEAVSDLVHAIRAAGAG